MHQGSKNPGSVGLGIDLGGTKIAGALFDSEGMVSPRKVLYLEKNTGHEVLEQMTMLIQSFFDRAAENSVRINGLGVAVPGIYDRQTGRVWAPNIPGWDDFPLMEELNDKLGNMDVSIDSDRACYVLGETWKGAATGCKNAVFLAVGTGIGAGILMDGKVLRGAHDIAGAIGWWALTDPFVPAYTKYGCFEYHASGPGISRTAKDIQSHDTDFFKNSDQLAVEGMIPSDIFRALEDGNPLAKKAIDQCIRFWGKACANLVSLLDPEKIIFGGGVFGPAARFLDEIYLEAKKWAQPISIDRVRFEPSKLGSDAGLYGAGFLSLKAMKYDKEV